MPDRGHPTSEMNRKTPLHKWHVLKGAQMGVFGGYEMPLWYPTGAKHEHLSVLLNAGLFDTSHMAVVAVSGPDAHDLLQLCFSKDLSACMGAGHAPLPPGRSVYGVFLDPKGHVIDDAIVLRPAEANFLVVVNAGMGAVIARHLAANAGSRRARIVDLSDQLGKIDIQGPKAAKVLGRILKHPETVFEKLVYFSFKGDFDPGSSLSQAVSLSDGTPILLSRTGYTGEFGFEVFVQPGHLPRLWEMVLIAGRDLGLVPCGLAARDSLRAGAVLPLSHQDIGAWPFVNNPWRFALPYQADQTGFTKPFIGAEALLNLKAAEHTLPFVGSDPRKVSTEEHPEAADADGNVIGRVLTCTTDMGIGWHAGRIYSAASPGKPPDFEPKGLSCGFVIVKRRLNPGDRVELRDRRRRIPVTIVDDIRPDRTARRPIAAMT
jgi:glycine cleavage system T protein (aminomethyltransferase)